MSNWSTNKLGDICEANGGNIRTGPFGTQLHKSDYQEVGIPVVNPQDLVEGKVDTTSVARVGEDHVGRLSQHKLNEGDIIYARRGDIGRRAYITEREAGWLCGTGCLKIDTGNDELDSKFLFYYLGDEKVTEWIYNQAVGATMANLNTSILSDVTVRYPSINQQIEIASILSAFDDLIENNTRRIEILEEMARRIYREWFVHFRYPGHEDDELVDSGTDEFNAVPEGWDMQVMDEILEHYIGGTWGQEEPEGEENNPAYVIRGTDIPGGRSGNVDDIPLRYHKQSYINSRKLQHGDIVFEVSGGSKDQPVGRAMLITDTFLSELDCEDVVHASFCKLLRSNQNILKPEILYLHIREIYDDRRIMKYQVQSTGITNFKFTFFAENKQMFIPPMELQEKFQEKVSPLFEQMYILGKQINRLKETRDLLLPKLISGKIEVGNLKRQITKF